MAIGQRVSKVGGDYSFEGEIVAEFTKRSGVKRFVVENDDGVLFIFNTNQLVPASAKSKALPRLDKEAVLAVLREYCAPSGISLFLMRHIKDELEREILALGEK